MTDTTAEAAFETHDAYERTTDGFSLTTTPLDGLLTIEDSRYRVLVRVPTLDAVTDERVEAVLVDGWFDTLSLRLADAPGVTRPDVDVPEPTVKRAGDTVAVTFAFVHDDPGRAAETAKALVEYVEGTYVEGIVPGFSYQSPAADLLSRARTQGDGEGDGESGAMPL